MLCPNCGRHNVSTVEVCGACGTALPAVKTPQRQDYVPSGQASAAPYAAPAPVQLKKMNVLTVAFLSLVTMGVYSPIWFLIHMDSLNGLNSTVKLKKGAFITVIILFMLSIAAALASVWLEKTGNADNAANIELISRFFNISGGLILLVECFKVRRMLMEHFDARLSGVATFFLNILYLQYRMNRF